MAVAEIGLRRLASQHLATGHYEHPAEVVRWLGAVQAQDYNQSLWAIGSRLRKGTVAGIERAISERSLVRTWLMRGTIHYAPPEDVRWLLALVGPRLKAADERRREQIGLPKAHVARSAELLAAALVGDRRLSRPEVMELLEGEGIATGGGHGYHILWRLAQDGLICIGPMSERQQTFVLLDDWAPPQQARDLSHEESLAALARRFATSRGPVTAHDLARWAGITVADARAGCSRRRTVSPARPSMAPSTGSQPTRSGRRRRRAGVRTCSPASTSTCSATGIAMPSSIPSTPARSPRAPTASSGR